MNVLDVRVVMRVGGWEGGLADRHTDTYVHLCGWVRARAHTHTHTHTRKNTHTHTHTHTYGGQSDNRKPRSQ